MLTASRYFLLFAATFGIIRCGRADEAEVKFSDGINYFTVNWLKALSKTSAGNVLVSPASAGVVLGIIQQGAKENSAAQLENALKLNAEETKNGYRRLTGTLKKEKNNLTLEWGNGAYFQKGIEVKDEFKQTVLNDFDASLQQDYPDAVTAAARMNEEIANITHNLIRDLFEPQSITGAVALFYNAMYLKGYWEEPFPLHRTRTDKFHVTAEEKIDARFMNQILTAKAGEDSTLGIKWIELSYVDPDYSMILVLPTERHGLNAVIEKLTDADLKTLINNRNTKPTQITIPKFKLSLKQSVTSSLAEIGISDIFSGNANLRGISESDPPLVISDIIQQVNVEVDEVGTEAAAATGAILYPLSLPVFMDDFIFKADEPFLFFIVHKSSRVPLFAGKIINPTS